MIIGIDLGTTNSLAAYYTEEGPRIIPNRLGERLTPSAVSIDENDQVYVGRSALERMAVHPDEGASLFKRSMGSRKEFVLGKRTFSAEELSSFVLRSLKEDAEYYLGEEVTEAVISVPAYFNDVKRKATKRAGELAGFKVERIISEPMGSIRKRTAPAFLFLIWAEVPLMYPSWSWMMTSWKCGPWPGTIIWAARISRS